MPIKVNQAISNNHFNDQLISFLNTFEIDYKNKQFESISKIDYKSTTINYWAIYDIDYINRLQSRNLNQSQQSQTIIDQVSRSILKKVERYFKESVFWEKIKQRNNLQFCKKAKHILKHVNHLFWRKHILTNVKQRIVCTAKHILNNLTKLRIFWESICKFKS